MSNDSYVIFSKLIFYIRNRSVKWFGRDHISLSNNIMILLLLSSSSSSSSSVGLIFCYDHANVQGVAKLTSNTIQMKFMSHPLPFFQTTVWIFFPKNRLWTYLKTLDAFHYECAHNDLTSYINPFKYHVSCTDGKISVRINLLFYFYLPPSFHLTVVCFCHIGLSLLIQHFQQVLELLQKERNIQMLNGTMMENKGKTINLF